MAARSNDTTDEADDVQIAAYRAMTPAQRVEIAFQLSDDMREVTLGGIRTRHRELDDRGVHHEFLRILYGSPRSTQDIDLVFDPTPEQPARFVDGLDPDRFYAGNAVVARQHRSMFKVIEPSTGFKGDLIFCKDRPFSDSEFRRREPVEVLGVQTAIATVEDTILAKVERADASESARHDPHSWRRARPRISPPLGRRSERRVCARSSLG